MWEKALTSEITREMDNTRVKFWVLAFACVLEVGPVTSWCCGEPGVNIVLCECTLQSPGGVRDCFSLPFPGTRHAQLALMQSASSRVFSVALSQV